MISSGSQVHKESIIFTEVLKKGGFGHFFRCSALYEKMLKYGLKVRFIAYTDFDLYEISASFSYERLNWTDTDALMKFFGNEKLMTAVVDSYTADLSVYNVISRNCEIMVCLDDFQRLSYPSGCIILNPGIFGDKENYQERESFILGGIKYALLRTEFTESLQNEIPGDNERHSVLITVGGSDNLGVTPLLIEETRNIYPDLEINVIVGAGFQNTDEIKAKLDSKIKLHFRLSARDIAILMKKSLFAVTAGGQTLYELSCAGTPMLVVQTALNQQKNIQGFLEKGEIYFVGRPDDEDFRENLRTGLTFFQTVKSEKKEAVIDGLGASRVVEKILSLCNP